MGIRKSLLLGVGLLRAEAEPSGDEIVITPGVVEHLLEDFRLTWQRPPTESESKGLVEGYLRKATVGFVQVYINR